MCRRGRGVTTSIKTALGYDINYESDTKIVIACENHQNIADFILEKILSLHLQCITYMYTCQILPIVCTAQDQ